MKKTVASFVSFCLLWSLVIAVGGGKSNAADSVTSYSLYNGDYEQPADSAIPGWGTYIGSANGSVTLDTRSHGGSHSLNLTNGFIAAWNVLNADPSKVDAPHIGDRVQAQVWVMVPAGTTLTAPFEMWVEEVDASGGKRLIAKASLPNTTTPGAWTLLTTEPVEGGVMSPSAKQLVVSYQDWVTGTLLLDDLTLGATERGVTDPGEGGTPVEKPKPVKVDNGSFENGLAGWEISEHAAHAAVTNKDSYYGNHALEFKTSSGVNASVTLTQTVGGWKPGAVPEAGAWVKLVKGADLALKIEGVKSDGSSVLLAKSPAVDQVPQGTWTYLLTNPLDGQSVTDGMTVKLSIQSSGKGTTLVDFVQAGPQFSITGNPEKYAMLAYQPWYGNPNNWHNWKWTGGGGPDHNPDVILPNGQRDTASYYYPLIGAYDSTDPDVLRYHVNLAKAMGFDCIQVNWYANLEPHYVKSFETLLAIAEESDMKVSVLYEPKIHLANWIPHQNRQEQIEGIVQDIIHIDQAYGNRKGMLKIRGRTVVGIFGAATTGLSSGDWDVILKTVHDRGDNPYMMGDVITSTGSTFLSSFDSMFNWILYADELVSNQEAEHVKSFSERINKITQKWVGYNPVHRLGVGIVWPGFNDSGVYAWGSGNSRVIPESDGFYQATWDGMMNAGFDWVLVATFNDWNESTSIEPSKEFGYTRAILTQNNIERFKGIPAMEDDLIKEITEGFLKKYRAK